MPPPPTSSFLLPKELLRTPTASTVPHVGYLLHNGAKLIVVQDSNCTLPTAVMNIHAGQLNDFDSSRNSFSFSSSSSSSSSSSCIPNIYGLAHFCEHMVFMGTASYPTEDGFNAYIGQHNGSSNAYTANDETVYYFHMQQKEFLSTGIKMFLDFFIAPLFQRDTVDRERDAVHSEDEKNHLIDYWRKREVLCTFISPLHPNHYYTSGNRDTLLTEVEAMVAKGLQENNNHNNKGEEVSKAAMDLLLKSLKDYHDHHYTADRATLVIYSPFSPETVLPEVVPLLNQMKKGTSAPTVFTPLPPDVPYCSSTGGWLNIKSIQPTRQLTLSFPVSLRKVLNEKEGRLDPRRALLLKPQSYISHILGHECESSVLGRCKALHYATEMMVGPSSVDDDYQVFSIVIDLTQHGMAHVMEVIQLIYFAIAQAVEHGTVNTAVFENMKEEETLSFESADIPSATYHSIGLSTAAKYLHPGLYTSTEKKGEVDLEALSWDLRQVWPAQEMILPNPHYCAPKEEARLAVEYVKQLTPENCTVQFVWGDLPEAATTTTEAVKKQFAYLPSFAQHEATQKTKYHQTPFSELIPIPKDIIEQWSLIRRSTTEEVDRSRLPPFPEGLALPSKNPYIATDFTIFDSKKITTVDAPVTAIEPSEEDVQQHQATRAPLSRGVLRADPRHHTFKTALRVGFLSPVAYTSPLHRLFAMVFLQVAKYKLTEKSYYGELASMENNLDASAGGLGLTVVGPSQRVLRFLLENIQTTFTVTTTTTKTADEDKKEEEVFLTYFEEVRQNVNKTKSEQPYKTALRLLHSLYGHYVIRTESVMAVLEEKERENPSDLHRQYQAYVQDFIQSGFRLECFAAGNMEDEKPFYDSLLRELKPLLTPSAPPPPSSSPFVLPRFRDSVALESRVGAINLMNGYSRLLHGEHPTDPNKAVVLSIAVSQRASIKERCTAQVISKLLSSLFFSALRSQETLGYIVSADYTLQQHYGVLQFMVQSALPQVDEAYLLSRIIAFLDGLRCDPVTKKTFRERFPPGSIHVAKQGLHSALLKRPNSVSTDLQQLRTDYLDPHQYERAALQRRVLSADEEGALTVEEVYSMMEKLFSESFYEHYPSLAVMVHPMAGADDTWREGEEVWLELPPQIQRETQEGNNNKEEETPAATTEEPLHLPTYRETEGDGRRKILLRRWKEIKTFHEGLEVIRDPSF